MQSVFLEQVNQITLADRWRLEPVRGIKPHVSGLQCAAQPETGQPIDLNMPCALQPLFAGKDHKPMVLLNPVRTRLPYLPPPDAHRSILCFPLAIAFSKTTRSGSALV